MVAPHPDDETLGCGGTLLRMAADGARLGWLIVTDMSAAAGYADDRVRRSESEIDEVPWHVRLHDRSTVAYAVHLVVARRMAVSDARSGSVAT